MLSGSLWNKILMFAVPLAASSMLQQLFNSADVAVVGRFAGSRALAAVGSNGPVINLLVNIFVGLSVGANVAIARYLGAGNRERAKRAAHTAVLVAVISGLIICLLGMIITRPILTLMSTPDDIINLSVLYLRIYFTGMPFIMLYNFGSAIMRSRGDTKRPLLCLTVSGVVNVLLNLFFVIVCKMSVAGVGIATVISNIISSGMLLYFLMTDKSDLRINIRELKIDKTIFTEIARIGVPAGLQGMVFSLSNVCIQSGLNSLGSDYVAGSAAAINFEFMLYFLLNAFTQACVTFTGQNYGAGNYKRCDRVAVLCSSMAFAAITLLSVFFIIFGKYLLVFYTSEPIVIEYAVMRMKYVLIFQTVNMFTDVLSGSMRGMGCSLVPTIITAAGACGLRILWVYTVFAKSPDFRTLLLVYPVSWIVTSVAIFAAFMVVRKISYGDKIKAER
ncbi:MAG: MATE family efflux transporter [Oscillospiraceae bacterium]|nr:MATE family efflux transporter [Oscillospiraceae bacterium]